MKPSPDPDYRHRFPTAIISHVVWLYHVVGLSLRDVELSLAEHGVVVTHESIRHWCRKFGADLSQGDSWHLDEGVPRTHDQQWECGAA